MSLVGEEVFTLLVVLQTTHLVVLLTHVLLVQVVT